MNSASDLTPAKPAFGSATSAMQVAAACRRSARRRLLQRVWGSTRRDCWHSAAAALAHAGAAAASAPALHRLQKAAVGSGRGMSQDIAGCAWLLSPEMMLHSHL
jgi:hypothetical protein